MELSEAERKSALTHLRQPRPWLSILCILREWFFVILTVVICEKVDFLPLSVLGILFIATRIYALTELTHEGTHGNLFRTKRMHLRLEFLYSWPVFVNLNSYAPGHLRHHSKMNNLDADPSTYWLRKEGLFNTASQWRLVWILVIRPLLGYQALRELRELKYYLTHSPSHRKKLLPFWIFVLAAFIYTGLFFQLFFYWLLPFFWLGTTFRFWKEVEDHFNTFTGVRNVKPNRIYAFFLNPYQCGNHYLHHLEPNIPWHNMKKARALFKIPEQDVTHNFLQTLKQILRRQNHPDTWPNISLKLK